MSEQTFHDRLAVLEEHLVQPDPLTVEQCLDRAEKCLAKGWEQAARGWLRNAQMIREFGLDEIEEDDDGC
jgi:hypothetical protein